MEEDKRNKEPANIEAKRKRLEWEEQEAKRKKECKEKGEPRVYYTWKLNNDFFYYTCKLNNDFLLYMQVK